MKLFVLRSLCAVLVVCAVLLVSAATAHAREAAFMDPGAIGGARTTRPTEAISVEPKSDVDVGDTPSNIGRRATFFFVNQTNLAVTIENLAANGDSNVRAELVADDCSKGKQIAPGSRCSVTVEVTPNGIGSWTAEILLTHNASGRLTRARILGKTTAASNEKRDMGLSLNTKDSKPVDFGEVIVGKGKAARTALMVNDSNDTISILSIEVIAADNGLQRLDQGCETDMDLKPGESCPVTLIWKPEGASNVSTDLIIRHSGRLGFAVIPIRGLAKEPVEPKDGSTASSKGTALPKTASSGAEGKGGISPPAPPTAAELESVLAGSNMPPLSSADLPASATGTQPVKAEVSLDSYHLIGTVGQRAVIYKPDDSTAIVAVGEEIEQIKDKPVMLVYLTATEAEITWDGKKKKLRIEAVPSLTQRASSVQQERDATEAVEKTKKKFKKSSDDDASKPVPLPTSKK